MELLKTHTNNKAIGLTGLDQLNPSKVKVRPDSAKVLGRPINRLI